MISYLLNILNMFIFAGKYFSNEKSLKPQRIYPCYTLKSFISLNSTDYILNVKLNNKTSNIYIYINNIYSVEIMNEGSHIFNSQSSCYNLISNISNIYIYCSKDILCSDVVVVSQTHDYSIDSREIADIELSNTTS